MLPLVPEACDIVGSLIFLPREAVTRARTKDDSTFSITQGLSSGLGCSAQSLVRL